MTISNEQTVCEADSIPTSHYRTVNTTDLLTQYADTIDHRDIQGKMHLDGNNDKGYSITDAASEIEMESEGSFSQYQKAYNEPNRTAKQRYDTTEVLGHSEFANNNDEEPTSEEIRRTTSSTTANSFDQVAEELESELHPLEKVAYSESDEKDGVIYERNQNRMLANPEPVSGGTTSDVDSHKEELHVESEGTTVSEEHEVEEEVRDITTSSEHDHAEYEDEDEEFDEPRTYHLTEEEQVSDQEETNEKARSEEVLPDSEEIPDTHKLGEQNEEYRSRSAGYQEPTIGPPPSFSYRSERLSRNISDAMSNIWERFWRDDVQQIIGIIKNRFSQLAPYVRRFFAHLVAFWGSITYIRRAIAAFVRILNKDERVRELLHRIGWASATTLKIFLSLCSMFMSASLQFYHLMRNKIIPDIRRVIPIVYYKVITGLAAAAQSSPWPLVLGPFSLTFAIETSKLPNAYILHDKLSVDREDVTFTSVQDLALSIRQKVDMYRTRRGRSHETQYQSDGM